MKRKSVDGLKETDGVKKKKMSKEEKKQAVERAQQWAAQRKAAPTTTQKNKTPVASSPKPYRAGGTKAQQLKDAQERAAMWARRELKSPQIKAGSNNVARPPVMETAKYIAPTTQTSQSQKNSTSDSTSTVNLNGNEEKTAAVAPGEEVVSTATDAPKSETGLTLPVKVKVAVAAVVFLISLGLAVCTSCPSETTLCKACESTLLNLKSKTSSSRPASGSEIEGSTNAAQPVNGPLKLKLEPLEEWQKCRYFYAPSKMPGGGWGVYAAKDFDMHEMVEVSPMFIRFEHGIPLVKNTVMDDYIYGYARENPPKDMAVVALGGCHLFNHHTEPNVQWMGFGREPSKENPEDAKAVGFVATRAIKAGEELFSSYGLDDGGVRWFQERKLERNILPADETKLTPEQLENGKLKYCAKSFAGYGKKVFESRVLSSTPPTHTPLNASISLYPEKSAGFDQVIAKVPLKAGDIIDTAPALSLDVDHVVGTALAPLVFGWNVLKGALRINLRLLREDGRLAIQHQSAQTDWQRIDQWQSYEKLALLPVAGSIGMVERVGPKAASNCRLEVLDSGSPAGSATVILRLIATRNVEAGETLQLDIHAGGTLEERVLLRNEMQKTGQPLFWIRTNKPSEELG